jgi:ribonuclease D
LVEIAKNLPVDEASLMAIQGIGSKTVKRWGKELLTIVKANRNIKNAKPLWKVPRRLTPGQKQLANTLFDQLLQRATELGVSASLLGPRRDVGPLVTGDDSPLLHGWRHKAVGAELQKTLSTLLKPA